MRRKRMRLVSLILSAVCLLGCAVQPAPGSDSSKSNNMISTYAASQAEQNEDERTVTESLLPQTEDGCDTSESSVAPERANASENADNAAEKQATAVETAPPAAPKEPAIPVPAPEDKPAPAPTPAPTQKPAEKQEEEPAPVPTPEPAPTPKPAAIGNIYSIAEAIQAGNEYARAQYGVTIDTSMTTADSSYFPGTADSVAWLAENGGQAALTAAVKGNVDATFACLAAMDGAETVSAYARFNCTARYDAASDEYIVVVLYG